MAQYLFTYEGMDIRWLVPARLLIAGVTLFIYSLMRFKKQTFDVWKHRNTAINMVVYGLLGIGFCQYFYFLAINLSNAAAATIFQNVSPIFILICVCIMHHRKPKVREIAAIAAAITGLFLLSTHGSFESFVVPVGAMLAGFASAGCVMIYNCFTGDLFERYPLLMLQAWSFLMSFVFFFLFFQPWTLQYVPSVMAWLGILVVALVGNVAGYSIYLKGVQEIGPAKSILYAFTEPVTAAIITWLFLKTPFTPWDWAGFVLMFIMLVLITEREDKKKETE